MDGVPLNSRDLASIKVGDKLSILFNENGMRELDLGKNQARQTFVVESKDCGCRTKNPILAGVLKSVDRPFHLRVEDERVREVVQF